MTMQSLPISSVGCDPTRNLETEDDLSTATPPAGHRNSEGDHEFVSETIHFYFAPADRTRIVSITPSEVPTQWLQIIASSTFGNDVKIINNQISLCFKWTLMQPRTKVLLMDINSPFIRSLSEHTHPVVKRLRSPLSIASSRESCSVSSNVISKHFSFCRITTAILMTCGTNNRLVLSHVSIQSTILLKELLPPSAIASVKPCPAVKFPSFRWF